DTDCISQPPNHNGCHNFLAACIALPSTPIVRKETTTFEQGAAASRPIATPGKLPPFLNLAVFSVFRNKRTPKPLQFRAKGRRSWIWHSQPDCPSCNTKFRMILEGMPNVLQPIRGSNCIVVQEAKDLASSLSDGRIACVRKPMR